MLFKKEPLVKVSLVVLFVSIYINAFTDGKTFNSGEQVSGVEHLSVELYSECLQRARNWHLEHSHSMRGEQAKPRHLATALLQLARTEKLDNHLLESERLLKSAIQLAEVHAFKAELKARYYFQLGTLYELMENKEDALKTMKIARVFCEQSGFDALKTACTINIADLQTEALNEPEKSELNHLGITDRRLIQEHSKPESTKVWGTVAAAFLLLGGVLFGKWGVAVRKDIAQDKPGTEEETVLKQDAPVAGAMEVAGPKKSVWIREKNKRWIHIEVSEIISIEAKNNNVDMHTLSKSYREIGVSLLNMSRQLAQSGFIRTHRSFLVNMDHLKVIEDNYIFLTKGKALIGESYRKDLFDTLHLLRSGTQKQADASAKSVQHV